uniref:Conserved oligomeric Golgi complex subunit 8 n=1 Tax=Megaselia scalaris TaxID=36166 RepID=T1GIH6_MEGSC
MEAQQHITKTIEVTRVNLFNIITQYKAIFPDDNQKPQETDGGRIFESWINRRINIFLEVLEEDLSSGISSMDTVLGQCMYFGQSFGRVGADFRGLMVPIFLKVITKNFSTSITKVNQTFRANLEKYTLLNKVNFGLHTRKLDDQKDEISPPETLLDFQPLAFLCNGYLDALNELRLCTPVALVFEITKIFQESLEFVAQQIFYFYRTEKQKFYGSEKENFIKFASCFAYDLIPYVQRCIYAIFPQETVATNLGINLTTVQGEGIGVIQQKTILEPLKELLPNKMDIILRQESALGAGSALLVNKFGGQTLKKCDDNPRALSLNISNVLRNELFKVNRHYETIKELCDENGDFLPEKFNSWFKQLFENEFFPKNEKHSITYNRCTYQYECSFLSSEYFNTMEIKCTNYQIVPYKVQFIPCISMEPNNCIFHNEQIGKWYLIPTEKSENKFQISLFKDENIIYNENKLKIILKVLDKIRVNNEITGLENYHFETVLLWMVKNDEIPKAKQFSNYD